MSEIKFYPHIKDIFMNNHVHEMKKVTVTTGQGAFGLDLHDYESVRELAQRIKIAIEGYGYQEDQDYDDLEMNTRKEFIKYLRESDPQNDFFEKFIDRSKLTSRAMPPYGGPLKHADITKFNDWIKAGMPEGEHEQ